MSAMRTLDAYNNPIPERIGFLSRRRRFRKRGRLLAPCTIDYEIPLSWLCELRHGQRPMGSCTKRQTPCLVKVMSLK
jgi:hypothetical protein